MRAQAPISGASTRTRALTVPASRSMLTTVIVIGNTRPEELTRVLGIVYRAISGHLIGKAGSIQARASTGAVTVIHPASRCMPVSSPKPGIDRHWGTWRDISRAHRSPPSGSR